MSFSGAKPAKGVAAEPFCYAEAKASVRSDSRAFQDTARGGCDPSRAESL